MDPPNFEIFFFSSSIWVIFKLRYNQLSSNLILSITLILPISNSPLPIQPFVKPIILQLGFLHSLEPSVYLVYGPEVFPRKFGLKEFLQLSRAGHRMLIVLVYHFQIGYVIGIKSAVPNVVGQGKLKPVQDGCVDTVVSEYFFQVSFPFPALLFQVDQEEKQLESWLEVEKVFTDDLRNFIFILEEKQLHLLLKDGVDLRGL